MHKEPSYAEYAGCEKEPFQKNDVFSKESSIHINHDSSTNINNATQDNSTNSDPPLTTNKTKSNGTKTHNCNDLSQFSTSVGLPVSLSDTVKRLKHDEQETSKSDCTSLRLFRKRKSISYHQNEKPISNISSLPGSHEILKRNMEFQNSLSSTRYEKTTNDTSDLNSNAGCLSDFPATLNQIRTSTFISHDSPLISSSSRVTNTNSESNTNCRSTYR